MTFVYLAVIAALVLWLIESRIELGRERDHCPFDSKFEPPPASETTDPLCADLAAAGFEIVKCEALPTVALHYRFNEDPKIGFYISLHVRRKNPVYEELREILAAHSWDPGRKPGYDPHTGIYDLSAHRDFTYCPKKEAKQ
jgi:hypothetical protein